MAGARDALDSNSEYPSHEEIIDFLHHPSFSYLVGDGVCFGYTHVVMQSFLMKDLNAFRERLEFMKTISPQELSDRLRLITEQAESNAETTQIQTLSRDDQKYMDVYAFLETLAIYQSLWLYGQEEEYKNLLPENKIVPAQSASASMSWTLPKRLEETYGGITTTDNLLGIYDEIALCAFFNLFRNHVRNVNHLRERVFLVMGIADHIIGIGYDTARDVWTFSDINAGSQINLQEVKSTETLANYVYDAFEQRKSVIATAFFFPKNVASDYKKVISEFNNHELHLLDLNQDEINDTELRYLAYGAAKYGNLHLLEQVYSKIQDINKPVLLNDNPYTILYIACRENQQAIIEFLLSDRHLKVQNNEAEDLNLVYLQSVINNENLDAALMLLKRDVMYYDFQIKDLFSKAVKKNHTELIKYLLWEKGDCIGTRDIESASNLAISQGNQNLADNLTAIIANLHMSQNLSLPELLSPIDQLDEAYLLEEDQSSSPPLTDEKEFDSYSDDSQAFDVEAFNQFLEEYLETEESANEETDSKKRKADDFADREVSTNRFFENSATEKDDSLLDNNQIDDENTHAHKKRKIPKG